MPYTMKMYATINFGNAREKFEIKNYGTSMGFVRLIKNDESEILVGVNNVIIEKYEKYEDVTED